MMMNMLLLGLCLLAAAVLGGASSLRSSSVEAATATVNYDFDLDNSFYYGKFEMFSSVDIILTSDETVDFWFTGKTAGSALLGLLLLVFVM